MFTKRCLLFLSCSLAMSAMANPVYPINPQQYGKHKAFGPPKPITPKTVLTATPENQFDQANRDIYPNAVNRVNDRVDKPFHFTLGQYGDSTYTGALWRQREANYYVIGSIDYTKAKDYKDGNNNPVGFGYERKGGALVLGVLPSMKTEHRLTFVYDDVDDDKQPQHVMDPVNTRRFISKYNGRFGAQDNSNTVNVELKAIDVKRNANNFDLRPNKPPMKKIFLNVKRKKYLADIHYNYKFNEQNRSSIGLRYQDDTHDAKRFVKTPMGNKQNGYRFPDIKTKTTSLYASHEWKPNQQHSVKGALDYTWQEANPRAASQKFVAGMKPTLPPTPIIMSSAGLWQAYYGKKIDGKIKHSGLSGKLRYTFSPKANQQFYGEFASLYRMPENPERFAVLPGPGKGKPLPSGTINQVGKGWSANPWIKPERENRITLGMKLSGDGWGGYQITKQDEYASAWLLSGEIFYASVDNFITLDRYPKINHPKKKAFNNNIITRNVDAKLAGINLKYQQNWTQNLSSSLGLQYRYGKNKTDNRPLYQITPLEASLSVDWQDYFDGGSYSIGTRLRHQAKQHRRDDNPAKGLGIDIDTDGFTTLDIYGGVEWKNNFGVSLGVDNVFDKEYAEYMTGNHVEAIAPKKVNAPGRTFWLRLNAAF